MKSLVSNHNHNTSGHSLRKFRNTKYFQDQRGYETDYMKRRNDGLGSTPQQKKGKNKFDDQVNEYLRRVGSGYSESMIADDNKNLDYASEVESKIKSLEAKHLASSVIFQKLSHCHSELMNLHNTKVPSQNNTVDRANLTNRSIEHSGRNLGQRQFKSQSNLAIISTPYKSPSFQNKKNAKSLQINNKPAFFNHASNGETISKILESSLDKLDEEDMAENISIKEKILDSLNDPMDHEFDNYEMNRINEKDEYDHKKARNLQSEINHHGHRGGAHQNLDESCEHAMQNVDESDAYSISQKLILLGSNIKTKQTVNREDSYYLSPNMKTPGEKIKDLENRNQYQSTSLQNNKYMQNQMFRYQSPESTQKKPISNNQNANFQRKNDQDKNIAQQLIGMPNQQQQKLIQPSAQQQQQMKQVKIISQKTPEKKIVQTARDGQTSAQAEAKKSPSENKQGQQSSSKKKLEKYYIQQVERQTSLVQQQQKQIVQYQQQLQQQTLEFQLFMQEQQLMQQSNYFQQQQQLISQQRNSANFILQQPGMPYPYGMPSSQSPLFSFNPLNSPMVMSSQNPTQNGGFMPQVPPPIIINNNIQKNNEDENGQNNNTNTTHLNGSAISQQQQRAYLMNNKVNSIQSPYYERNGDETLTPAGQQGTADHSQVERQTEQLFKNNNNNNSSFAGSNQVKKNSSQRRKWDIGQKTCTQSELSADEDYLTQYNAKQPKHFELYSQPYNPSHQNNGYQQMPQNTAQTNQYQHQQPAPILQQIKKPVKFDIFWEKGEIEQENKENQRNNSVKRNTNNPLQNEENKLESTIQKQYKNAIDQAESSTNATSAHRSLQDIFVSKKIDLQKKLDYEKNSQHQVMSYRNQSPDLSKEDLIQIRKDLLKPKAQQIIQSITFDSQNQSQSQSHFQSQFSVSNMPNVLQLHQKPHVPITQTIQKPVIQTSTIQLSSQQPITPTTQYSTGSVVTPIHPSQQQPISYGQQKPLINGVSTVNPQPQTTSLSLQQQSAPLNLQQQQQQNPNLNNQPSTQNPFQFTKQQTTTISINGQQFQPGQQPQQNPLVQLPSQPLQSNQTQVNQSGNTLTPQTPVSSQQPLLQVHQPYQFTQQQPLSQIPQMQQYRITSN